MWLKQMTDDKKPPTNKTKKDAIPTRHDALFKNIMESDIAAREFLTEYLPEDFKELVDLSKITVEKESFIEDDLTRRLSDIIYSIKTKDGDEAFVYILLEHQSKVDYWMAFRLLKYSMLLLERHIDKRNNKLPLIAPMLFYNGNKEYNAPLNLWGLFAKPTIAKQLLTENYQLVDVQSMSDDEIMQKQHLGMMEYFMKHIHQRDMIKVWESFVSKFPELILLDKNNGYIYTKKFLCYTDGKVAAENKEQLNKLILEHLSKKDGETIMKTIADSYIDEGVSKGILIGKDEGIAIGEARVVAIARRMLQENTDMKFIASVTGLSANEILKIKNTL